MKDHDKGTHDKGTHDKRTKIDLLEKLRNLRKQLFLQTDRDGNIDNDKYQLTDSNDKKEKIAEQKGWSNDAVDGFAAVVLILLFVFGMAYWLQSMP